MTNNYCDFLNSIYSSLTLYTLVLLDFLHFVGVRCHPPPNVPTPKDRRGRNHHHPLSPLSRPLPRLLPPKLDLPHQLQRIPRADRCRSGYTANGPLLRLFLHLLQAGVPRAGLQASHLICRVCAPIRSQVMLQ